MTPNIEKIFQELSALEPAFKNNEAAVKAIIAKLAAGKPQIVINRDFAAALRRELIKNKGIELTPHNRTIL